MSVWEKIQQLQKALEDLGVCSSIHVSIHGLHDGSAFDRQEAESIRSQVGAVEAELGGSERGSWLDIQSGDIDVTVFYDAKQSAAAGNSGE